MGESADDYKRFIHQISHELEEAGNNRGKQLLTQEMIKNGMDRTTMKKQLLQQQDENSSVRIKTKEKYILLVEKLVKEINQMISASKFESLLIYPQSIPRNVLHLSNRRSILQALQYPQSYYQCDCCKEEYA